MTALRSEGGDAIVRVWSAQVDLSSLPATVCNSGVDLTSWRSELLETISYARVMLQLFHALLFYRWLNNLLNKVLNVECPS